jgi:PAS domain S-box-containing protein
MRSDDSSTYSQFWEQVIDHNPITLACTASCLDATRLLGRSPIHAREKNSPSQTDCILLMDGSSLVGLLTSQDLLQLVTSDEHWQQRSLKDIAPPLKSALTLTADTKPIEAITYFQQHCDRYLPVIDQQAHLIGLISSEQMLQACWLDFEQQDQARTTDLLHANKQSRLWEQAINASSNSIVIADMRSPNIPIISVNPAFERITGYSAAEVIGQDGWFLLDNDPEQPAIAQLQAAIQAKTECCVIVQKKRKDGSWFWSELSIAPIFDADGQLTHYISIQKDITNQQQTEIALRQQLAAIEAATNGIAILNTNLEYIYVNNTHIKSYGYGNAESLIGKTWQELYYPDEIERIKREVFPILLQKGAYHGEATAKRIDGTTFAQEISLTLVDTGEVVCVCQDISDRKQEEAERQQAEKRLHLLESAVVHTRDAIIIADAKLLDHPDPQILYVNQAFTQITGYTPEEAIGQTTEILYGPKIKLSQLEKIRTAFKLQQPIRSEILNYRKDGSDYWADLTFVPIVDAQGNCVNWVATQRDITERKSVEKILLATQARFKYLLSSSPNVIYTCKPFGNYATTFISENITTLLGYDPWDFLKHPDFWFTHLHPADAPTVLATFERSSTEENLTAEYRFRTKDGRYIWLQDSFKLLRDSLGNPFEIIGSMVNISDRKQAEKALQDSQQLLQLVMNNIPQAIFWKDKNLRFLGCNQHFAQDAGLANPEEILGKSDFDMPWADEAEGFQADDLQIVQSNQPKLDVEKRVVQAGNNHWLRMSKVPLHDSDSNVVGVLGTYEDITERKQAEERLKASLREKEVLLKEIHHRVKNNLQVISSLLKLQAGYIRDKQTLEILQESQNRVRAMALIHEKLYQSKDLAKTDFAEYVRNLTRDIARSYGSPHNIQLKINIAEIRLSIDAAIPCGLIINELVSNSLKYAFPLNFAVHKTCEISICLRVMSLESYVLTIADNGIGLPEHIDIYNTPSLGLQLVCTLTEQLQGTIELDRNNGTQFQFVFADLKYKSDN